MLYYIRHLADNTVRLYSEYGKTLGIFCSIDDAIATCLLQDDSFDNTQQKITFYIL